MFVYVGIFDVGIIRANQKPYVTTKLRKAIMLQSQLENRFYKNRLDENKHFLRRQKNYCNRLYKRERKNYYSKLNLKNVNDNRKFWNTMKPLLSDKGGAKSDIMLIKMKKLFPRIMRWLKPLAIILMMFLMF